MNARSCAVCGKPLSIHEQVAGQTCRQSHCKNKFLIAELQAESKRQAALQRTAFACRERVARSQAIDFPDQLTLSILPSNDRRMRNLPAKRTRRFQDRLMQIISQAAAKRYGPELLPPETDQPPSEPSIGSTQLAVLGNACATCRGNCCPQGGDHAFLQVETILEHMRRHPQQRPRHVLQAYMSYVGEKTYHESCVYHAEDGCRLPREMRSRICNEFLCKGLNEVLAQLSDSPDQRIFVVAAAGEDISRAAVIDQHQRTLYDVSGEPLDAGGIKRTDKFTIETGNPCR